MPGVRAASDLRQRLDRRRLGQAWHTLEQHVAARQERDEQTFEEVVLSDDEPPELEQDLLHDARCVLALRRAGRKWIAGNGGCHAGLIFPVQME